VWSDFDDVVVGHRYLLLPAFAGAVAKSKKQVQKRSGASAARRARHRRHVAAGDLLPA
jgi:hypothetical protein